MMSRTLNLGGVTDDATSSDNNVTSPSDTPAKKESGRLFSIGKGSGPPRVTAQTKSAGRDAHDYINTPYPPPKKVTTPQPQQRVWPPAAAQSDHTRGSDDELDFSSTSKQSVGAPPPSRPPKTEQPTPKGTFAPSVAGLSNANVRSSFSICQIEWSRMLYVESHVC
jgi:hypothetical protein